MNAKLRLLRATIIAKGENEISVTYSECVSVNLVIQHAKRLHRIVMSVACPAVSFVFFFFAICHINGKIFGKELTEHKICVLIFPTMFIRNISHSEKNFARYCHKCT